MKIKKYIHKTGKFGNKSVKYVCDNGKEIYCLRFDGSKCPSTWTRSDVKSLLRNGYIVEVKDTSYKNRYFINSLTEWPDTLYIIASKNKSVCVMRDGERVNINYDVKFCEKKAHIGLWKEISYNEVRKLRKKFLAPEMEFKVSITIFAKNKQEALLKAGVMGLKDFSIE